MNPDHFEQDVTPDITDLPLDATEADAFGGFTADLIASMRQDIQRKKQGIEIDDVEEQMRLADYLIAERGSTEELVGDRRILSRDFPDPVERERYVKALQQEIHDEENKMVIGNDLSDLQAKEEDLELVDDEEDDLNGEEIDPETYFDPNQLAHGDWSEMLVTVDRTTKLWRGGRLESYRALVVGGNFNGCGGFGIGKAADALRAVEVASRKCKRNIFFVDRYQDDGLTHNLVGKQNSCKVVLRSVEGLRGNYLCREILKRFGIVNASAKAHGNRNPYNVVQATFKALMTHESIEDIALKLGKRLVSVDRAKRMNL